MFKVGEKVVCIDAGKTKMKNNHTYTVRCFHSNPVTKNKCTISLIEFPKNSYKLNRFVKSQENRKQKIKKICSLME